jgi:hypothetical protein
VKLDGESNYTINGTLQLANNTFIRINYSGEIIFEPDLPTATYSLEVQKPYTYSPDGATFISVDGSQLNKISVYEDDVLAAYFEIVTAENPASLSGTYPVSGTITDTDGAAVRGSYVDLPALGWGTEIVKGGSYLMEDDIEQFLFDGNLTIVDNNGTLTFTGADFSILDIASPFYAPTVLPGVVKSVNLANATNKGE